MPEDAGVTNEASLIVEIGDQQAGGTAGQLILEDVEFRKQRDNEMKHGVGNETPQGISTGNITYECSASAVFNGAAADLARSLDKSTTLTGSLYVQDDASEASDFGLTNSYLDWNDVRVEATDDGDVIMEVDFDARGPQEAFKD